MEQRDHIATLCAAGTVGIAATGLAFGIQTGDDHAYSTTPGKRKWPGAPSHKSSPAPQPSASTRRVVSQPATSTVPTIQRGTEPPRPSSLFRRPSKREVRPASSYDSDATGSRGSSMNRSRLFRPRTADTRSTIEQRDTSANSSWLKRISSVSSPRASSPGTFSSKLDVTLPHPPLVIPIDRPQQLPNKLVKRSTSQRALSNDHASGIFLRRPATSHQRSVTVHEWIPRETSYSTPATPYLSSETESIWRPFFERGYSRKRHSSASVKDGLGPKTISATSLRQPTLILGSEIEPLDTPNDRTDTGTQPNLDTRIVSTGRQRLKRSLSSIQRASRRRHVTDPTVQVTTEVVNGTITPAVKHSTLSPALRSSPFEVDSLHHSSPYSSSPPFVPVKHRFSFRKRQSTAPSDPTTVSSDTDTRVFTDDDSMDFQSDTAYDSLTTRATVSSHSAFRTPRLDMVFNDPQAMHPEEADVTLARLVQKATLTDDLIGQYSHKQNDQLRGIGITDIEEESDRMAFTDEPASTGTPIRSALTDGYNITPVPDRLEYFSSPLRSSPPVLAPTTIDRGVGTPEFVIRSRHADHDDEEDEIDWSPKSDRKTKTSCSTLRQGMSAGSYNGTSSPVLPSDQSYFDLVDEEENDAEKRLSSIFDWSEHQKMNGDGIGGMTLRPKTVHGKQGHNGSRSRSSGRKVQSQMHLRSQSVPNNRDPNAEPTPLSTSKFGTWGLGHKPVSEEWSDDFEFDDAEDEGSPQISTEALRPATRGTLRGVKVPQAIIDRQASVHVQFGQVQEFMLLVEELKNLRARGAALQLLDTNSKQLWEDAESIIDLATINNEEDDVLVRPSSPTSSDIFGDEISIASKYGQEKTATDETKRSSTAFRSVSSPATPPHGRPRGESLAHAKNFLQSIHQSRSGMDSSPLEIDNQPHRKLPFDTQDLKDLVVRSGVITRALKEIIRKAEGLSVSPNKTPPRPREPAFNHIFNAPDSSPCPPFRKPGLPKSQSANSYLVEKYGGSSTNIPTSPATTALIL